MEGRERRADHRPAAAARLLDGLGQRAVHDGRGLLRNEELLKIQNKYFEESGKRDKIIQLTGNAKEILNDLNETYDLVFIDADKENYIGYFNQVSERLNKNGIIISDNVLWSGKVLDSSLEKDEETNALVNFNKILNEDKRFETVILPLRDGLSISRLI